MKITGDCDVYAPNLENIAARSQISCKITQRPKDTKDFGAPNKRSGELILGETATELKYS
jgi:hypothetical protein